MLDFYSGSDFTSLDKQLASQVEITASNSCIVTRSLTGKDGCRDAYVFVAVHNLLADSSAIGSHCMHQGTRHTYA